MLESLQKFAEWYLGAAPTTRGESTEWHVRTADWLGTVPPWAMALAAVAIVCSVVAVYRRDARNVSWRRRWTLVGLRLATLTCLVALLAQVTLSVDRTGLPIIAVMIDTSASMQFQDDYTGTADAATVSTLTTDETELTRLTLAKAILTSSDSGVLKALNRRYRVRLYQFDGKAEALRPESNTPTALAAAIDLLEATGQATAPAAATRRVLEELRASSPVAVVVMTDGISSEGDANRLAEIAPLANRFAVPIYTVGVGSSRAARDLELTDVRVDEVAIVNQTVLFTGELHARGFNNRDVVLELRNVDTKERLAARAVRLTAETQTVELSYVPTVAGEFDLTLAVVPLEEENVIENNFGLRHVSVRSGTIRVLLVERMPRYEFRYVKQLLEREVAAGSMELDTVLLDADPEWTSLDTSASRLNGRIPASQNEINAYDVIVFGDVDPSLLSPTAQTALRDFVREHGGGMVMIAGPKHNPFAFRGTDLEPLVPFPLDRLTSSDFRRSSTSGVKSQPTLTGRRATRLFRFGSNETTTARLVSQFPELHSTLRLTEVAPGASVLVEGTSSDDNSERPLVITQQYGAGRVVFHATDDLWMWRYQAGDETYGRYWVSLVRYLSRSRLLGRDRAAELVTNREVYNRGEDVDFQLRFFDSRRQPVDQTAEVTIELAGGAAQTIEVEPSAFAADGTYTGSLLTPDAGTYHAWVSKPVFEGVPPSVDFRVENASRELLVRDMNRAGLQVAAKATRGRFYSVGNVRQLPTDLPRGRATTIERGQPIAIWGRPELLLLVALLLSLEWFLRKNARLV